MEERVFFMKGCISVSSQERKRRTKKIKAPGESTPFDTALHVFWNDCVNLAEVLVVLFGT